MILADHMDGQPLGAHSAALPASSSTATKKAARSVFRVTKIEVKQLP